MNAVRLPLIASEMPWLVSLLPAPVSMGDGDFWSRELELRHINGVWLSCSNNSINARRCCPAAERVRAPAGRGRLGLCRTLTTLGRCCTRRSATEEGIYALSCSIFWKKSGFVSFPQQRNTNSLKLSNGFHDPFHSYIWIICFLGSRSQISQAFLR